MKWSYQDKLEIYKLRKEGLSWSRLKQRYGVQLSNLKYMVKLMDRYGVEMVRKGKNTYYSPALKQEIIDQVLMKGPSQGVVSLAYALPNRVHFPIG